jgi:predicted nucleotidyltransferase
MRLFKKPAPFPVIRKHPLFVKFKPYFREVLAGEPFVSFIGGSFVRKPSLLDEGSDIDIIVVVKDEVQADYFYDLGNRTPKRFSVLVYLAKEFPLVFDLSPVARRQFAMPKIWLYGNRSWLKQMHALAVKKLKPSEDIYHLAYRTANKLFSRGYGQDVLFDLVVQKLALTSEAVKAYREIIDGAIKAVSAK